MESQTVPFNPSFEHLGATLRKRCPCIKVELEARRDLFIDSAFIEHLRLTFLAPLEKPSRDELTEELPLITALSVLIDLLSQGWKINAADPIVILEFETEKSLEAEKERIRRAHLIERDSQVREASVTAFIRSMEKRKLTPTGWHSIFSPDARRSRTLLPTSGSVGT